MKSSIAFLLTILLAASARAQEQSPQSANEILRRYVPGESFQYELRVRDRADAPELVGISRHTVEVIDGVGRERVEWISLKKASGEDLTEFAHKVPTYYLSLDPRAPAKLEKPANNPAMMGMVTDLFTFYFAVSAAAGTEHLHKAGDQYQRPEAIKGDFSDGKEFLVGQDVLQVGIKLVNVTDTLRVYETTMVPPSDATLDVLRDWMVDSTCEAPVNFQMVRPQGSQFLVLWGCERLTISSTVDAETGQIRNATMVNPLSLRMRICKDAALDSCASGPNLAWQRSVSLTLLRN